MAATSQGLKQQLRGSLEKGTPTLSLKVYLMSVEKVWHIMGEVDGKKIYLASRYDQKAAFKAAVEFSHRWPRVIIEHPKEE